VRIARLLLSCADRPGIVAAASRFLVERGANILQSDQHTTDPDSGTFFMRLEFRLDVEGEDDERAFEEQFGAEVAEPHAMSWLLSFADRRKRVAVLVSRYDHCLAELLWRWRRGELDADIPMVISNHTELEREAARFDVRFEYVPVRRDAKAAAESALLDLVGGGACDLIVLARYMQILSPTFLRAVRTPIINIHHSFLPAFAGADPYARAHQRGPLRHRGARRRPDHRAGRRAGHPPRDRRRPRAQGRRPRADRAAARGPVAPRGPRARPRQPDDRLPVRAA